MSDIGERVANLEARFEAVGQDLSEIRESVRRLDDRMEARFQQVDGRFETLEQRMTNGFRELRDDMHANFRWVMGGIAGAILTVVLSTLAQLIAR